MISVNIKIALIALMLDGSPAFERIEWSLNDTPIGDRHSMSHSLPMGRHKVCATRRGVEKCRTAVFRTPGDTLIFKF